MGIVWSGQPGRGTPGRLQLSELRWGALHPSTERAGEIGVFLIPQAGGNIGDAHVGLDEEMKGPLAAHDFKDFPVKIAHRRGMNAAGASWRPAQPFCSTRSRVGGLHHPAACRAEAATGDGGTDRSRGPDGWGGVPESGGRRSVADGVSLKSWR